MHYLEKELYDRITEGDKVFDFLQKGVLDGIWYLDLENPNNQFISSGFFSVFGYENSDFSENGKHWTSLIHPVDLKKSEELMAAHFANPEIPFGQIVRCQHKNGSTIWIRYKGIAVRNEIGEPIRMLIVNTTLNVSSLTELDKQSNNLHQSFDKVETQINQQNQNQIFGQSHENQAKNTSIQSFLIDVSEQKKLTNQLNSKIDLLAHLVETTKDSFLVFNENFQLIYANKQIEEYIGRRIEKLPIELSESLKIIHPSHKAQIHKIYEKACHRLQNRGPTGSGQAGKGHFAV